MFGRNERGPSRPVGPSAGDLARIQGGGLIQVVLSEMSPPQFHLFLNDQAVPQSDVETLFIEIDVDDAVVQATLTRHVASVTGLTAPQDLALFPGTVELVAAGRRLSVTALHANSLDGLWMDLGLKPDGSGHEVRGARALRVILTSELLEATLTWEDGREEPIFGDSGRM